MADVRLGWVAGDKVGMGTIAQVRDAMAWDSADYRLMRLCSYEVGS